MYSNLRNRRHRRITTWVAPLVAVTALGAVTVTTSAPPASAQAAVVTALVHTFPERPEPGDDVGVLIDIDGCTPGPVTAEVYFLSTDGSSQRYTIVTRFATRTTLLYRDRGFTTIPAAIAGWYGLRVVCGSYSPPKEPLASSLFVVGPMTTKTAELNSQTVVSGGSLTYSGDGCTGSTVEYSISRGARWSDPFDPNGTVAVAADGTWSGDVEFVPEWPLGTTTVRARCVVERGEGSPLYMYYEDVNLLEIVQP